MNLKARLFKRELTFGSWITLGHPSIAEIMATAGFDWLTIDLEHSAQDIGQAEEMIRVVERCGAAPLVRLSANDPIQIKRVMDAGAHGIIVPMVNSREQAEQAVRAVHYPPRGYRGAGLARAQGYGASFDEYVKWAAENTIVIVQIEHIKAVENIDSILAVEGVDGFIVGPYDLSGSLGVPGKFDHPDVVRALGRLAEIVKQTSKVPGYHVIPPSAKAALPYIHEGYRFIGLSLDTLFLGSLCRAELATIKKVSSQRSAEIK